MKLLSLAIIFTMASCASGPGPVTPKTRVERQMIGLLEKFDRWDYDGDGELDSSELNRGIKGLRGKTQQVNYTAVGVIEFYDANHNEKVSLREAQAGYRRADEVGERLRN